MWEEMIRDGTMPADINVRDSLFSNDYTALMFQAVDDDGTKEAMEWLLTRQPPADVNLRNKEGKTALMYAFDRDDPDKVRLLLEYGADRNIPNKEGITPLQEAKKSKRIEIIPVLESYFPDVSAAAIQERAAIARAKNEAYLSDVTMNTS